MRRAVKCETLTIFKRWSRAFSSKRFLVGAEVNTRLPESIGEASQNFLAPVGGVNAAVKPSSASKTINILNPASTCGPATDKKSHEKATAGHEPDKTTEETAAPELATSSLMNTSRDGTGMCTLGLPPHQCNRNLHLDTLDERTLHHNGKCFCCDGVLLNWSRNDDPWMVRERWYALTGYLYLLNGHDFVDKFRSHFENRISNIYKNLVTPDTAIEGEVTVEPSSVPKTNCPNFTGVYLDRFPHGKPHCPFVLNVPVNISLRGSNSNADAHTPEGGDPSTAPTCEQKAEKAVGETAAGRPTDAPKKNLYVCGMYPAVPPRPKQGEFAPNCPFVFGLPPHLLLSKSRLDEFYASIYSIDVGTSAAILAKSGFRFIGPGANEKCVYCEEDFITIFWNSNGNLLSRKRWNGLVQYIHLLKGTDFISEFFSHIEKVIKRLQSAPEGEHNNCQKLSTPKDHDSGEEN